MTDTLPWEELPIECPKCGALRLSGFKCLACHRAYMREWRKTHPLTPAQRMKDTARSYAGVYKRRGILQEQGCSICHAPDAEMHHEDYSKPLDVTWLCRDCHQMTHENVARETLGT